MSADLLRRAAAVLREQAGAATGGDWFNDEAVSGDGAVVMVPAGRIAHVRYGDDAAYIATMHPGVGLALADWLDQVADVWPGSEQTTDELAPVFACLRVARAVLGESA